MQRYQPSPRSGHDMSVQNAMHEVFTNVPKNVTATGKTGAAKNKMLQAIAFSKAGQK